LNAQGKTFDTFGQLMGVIYEGKKGAKPPSVVTREYVVKKKAGSLISLAVTDALNPQQKVDLIMKFVAKPGCKIFSESKGNIRIRVEDLQRIITSNVHITTMLADVLFMSNLGKKFSDFGEIANAQSSADLAAAKLKVFDYLRESELLWDPEFKMAEMEFALAQSEFFGDPMYLLKSSQLSRSAPFANISVLGESLAKVAPELVAQRKIDQDKILTYLGKNAMFTVSVQVYLHYIDALLDNAGYSADNVTKIFDNLRASNQRFTSFEELIRTVKETYSQ